MDKVDFSLGHKYTFNGYKLIVLKEDGSTELLPISKKVFEVLKAKGIPKQG